MRIQYQWTEREWREAVALAARSNRGHRAGTPLPGLTVALLAILLLGGVIDLVSTIRTSHGITLRGSLVPLLLLLMAAVAAVLAVLGVRRRRRISSEHCMPLGQCEVVLQESGWGVREELPATDRETAANIVAIEATAPEELTPAKAENPAATIPAALRPWADMVETRQGNRVIVFLRRDGFDALPTRSITPEQGGHIHRLVIRKLRPSVQQTSPSV